MYSFILKNELLLPTTMVIRRKQKDNNGDGLWVKKKMMRPETVYKGLSSDHETLNAQRATHNTTTNHNNSQPNTH